MIILLVNTDSPSYNAGIKAGDVLLKINGNGVNNIKDYRRVMLQTVGEKSIVVTAQREGKLLNFRVEIN